MRPLLAPLYLLLPYCSGALHTSEPESDPSVKKFLCVCTAATNWFTARSKLAFGYFLGAESYNFLLCDFFF